MAITRKRKEPSAGTDESEDSQEDDSGPSKKTATHHLNVKSSEHIPIPRTGTVPVVTRIIRLGEREEIARILLDTGSTVPLLVMGRAWWIWETPMGGEVQGSVRGVVEAR